MLDDYHSTALFYKILGVLFPERLDLYVAAVREALYVVEDNPHTNSGAVFVNAMREFAEEAGVNLGLKRPSSTTEADSQALETQLPMLSQQTLTPPSVGEAIWAETQVVLQRQMTRATYDAVLQGTKLVGREDNIYVIGVQSTMAHEWLENRLRDVVQRALSSVVGLSVSIEFRLLNGG